MAALKLNVAAVMTARVVVLNAALVVDEIADNIAGVQSMGSLATVIRQHSTVAQNARALREAYQNATRLDAIMIGDYLSGLTDGQLQTAFGLTAPQVTTLRTNKLTPAASQAAAIRSAAGQ
jgi:hypothetical protein